MFSIGHFAGEYNYQRYVMVQMVKICFWTANGLFTQRRNPSQRKQHDVSSSLSYEFAEFRLRYPWPGFFSNEFVSNQKWTLPYVPPSFNNCKQKLLRDQLPWLLVSVLQSKDLYVHLYFYNTIQLHTFWNKLYACETLFRVARTTDMILTIRVRNKL